MNIKTLDLAIIERLRRSFIPLARIAIFIIYFWFGILKLFNLSPASPLAQALTAKTIPMLVIHMIIVCSPLILVPHLAWSKPFVPTLEGQYIIKNVAIIALAIGIAAQTRPLKRTHS
jgi:uncharacterized membrane protein YkgB